MQKISVEINPEVITRFRDFGKLLVELGDLIEQINALMSRSEGIISSVQQVTQDISADLGIPEEAASRGTRSAAARTAATSAATMFFIVSQAPGLVGLMEDAFKLKEFGSLSAVERREVAERLRQEGKALQRISLAKSAKPAGGSRSKASSK